MPELNKEDYQEVKIGQVQIAGKNHDIYHLHIKNTVSPETIIRLGVGAVQKVKIRDHKYVYVISEEIFNQLVR